MITSAAFVSVRVRSGVRTGVSFVLLYQKGMDVKVQGEEGIYRRRLLDVSRLNIHKMVVYCCTFPFVFYTNATSFVGASCLTRYFALFFWRVTKN